MTSTEETWAIRVNTFRNNIVLFARVNGYDPEIPEIRDLIEDASRILQNRDERGDPEGFFVLTQFSHYIDPTSIGRDGSTFVIKKERHIHILKPWTIVRRIIPNIDERLSVIRVGYKGTHLFDHTALVTIETGSINPRNRDSGGFDIACQIIEEFAGRAVVDEITLRQPDIARIRHIAVIKEDGDWMATVHSMPS